MQRKNDPSQKRTEMEPQSTKDGNSIYSVYPGGMFKGMTAAPMDPRIPTAFQPQQHPSPQPVFPVVSRPPDDIRKCEGKNPRPTVDTPTGLNPAMLQHGAKGLEVLMERLTDFNTGSSVGKSFPNAKPSLKEAGRSLSGGEPHEQRHADVPHGKLTGLEGLMYGPPSYGPLMGQIPGMYRPAGGQGGDLNPAMIHAGMMYGAGLPGFQTFMPTPVAPVWLQQPLPPVYQTALRSCILPGNTTGYPDTVIVYQVLMQSGLSREALGHIWSLANRTLPGQLTPTEFYIALALVGYAQQHRGSTPSIDAIFNLTEPPNPVLMSFPATTTKGSAKGQLDQPRSSGIHKLPVELPKPNQLGSTNAVTSAHECTTVLAPVLPDAAEEEDDFSEFKSGVAPVATDVDKTLAPQLVVDSSTDKYAVFRSLAPAPLQTTQSLEGSFSSQESMTGKLPVDGNINALSSGAAKHSVLESTLFPRSHSHGEKLSTTFFLSKTISADPDKMISQQLTSLFSGSLHSSTPNSNAIGLSPDTSRPQSPGADSVRSLSHEPSLRSLELKPLGGSSTQVNSPEEMSCTNAIESTSANQMTSLSTAFDKYAAVRELIGESSGHSSESTERHIDVWTKCLSASYQLITEAAQIFGDASSSSVCKEVVSTAKGATFIRSVGEIYRVACRIKLSLKTTAFQTEKLVSLLCDIHEAYENLTALVGFTKLLPSDSATDFRAAIVKVDGDAESEKTASRACGVCLLNVDAKSRCDSFELDGLRLDYGGKCYHSQCANLWINCVDSLLPALSVPSLL